MSSTTTRPWTARAWHTDGRAGAHCALDDAVEVRVRVALTALNPSVSVRNHGWFEDLLFGSVSNCLKHRVSLPILLIKSRD